ncbi:methionine aminopeptidase 1D, mitochondrial [Frankliniella occidentalis]|uniref:Methionine aminopeptidase n=1 Tax=Frankliniella occidentalis TaxID=133901 RepID=A0A6J1SHQ2_FRAOC|nr:methionine aminopeptidase 1D, mitochondrial [Frankliniella occidentalis]
MLHILKMHCVSCSKINPVLGLHQMSPQNFVRNVHLCRAMKSPPFKYFSEFLLWQKKKNFGKYSIVSPSNVTEHQRTLPPHIPKPPYFSTGQPPPVSFTVPEVKDQNSVKGMKRACRLARKVLDHIGREAKIGVTTEELDRIAHELIIEANAYPSPLYYKGFPKSVCTSVNNVVCHGIPDDRPLEDGDIVNIDVTVYFDGFHGDCSKTFLIGNVDEYGRRLVEVTELCLKNAIEVCKPHVPFTMIGNVAEDTARNHGFTVLPAILGHGIGSYFHGPPEVWHVCNDFGGEMRPGNTFTIEPAVTQGGMELELLDDGWTVITADQARTAQCEHTVLITESGVEILTELSPE